MAFSANKVKWTFDISNESVVNLIISYTN